MDAIYFSRRFALRLAVLASSLVATGAVQPAPFAQAQAPQKTWVIGTMIWNTSIPFYANFIKGQQAAAAALKVNLKMVNGKGDLATEVAAIRQMIADHVDAILVTASDAQGMVPAVKLANAAGIPVFAVNNRVGDDAQVVSFIGADDVEFGRQQAKLLAKSVGPKARVAYLMGAVGTSAQLLRLQGFTEVMKEHAGIHVVSSQSSGWDAAKALTVVQDWLNRYPKGGLDAIVGQGPESVNAARYAAMHGRSEVKFILGDYPAEVRQAILDGHVTGSVDQDPRPQGVRSVTAAVAWLHGDKSLVLQPNEYLPLPIVTQANAKGMAPAWGE